MYVCMCVGLGLRRGWWGGGGRLGLVGSLYGVSDAGWQGWGGGGFPVCDVNITSQMWKCVQSENSFVLLQGFNKKKIFYLNE